MTVPKQSTGSEYGRDGHRHTTTARHNERQVDFQTKNLPQCELRWTLMLENHSENLLIETKIIFEAKYTEKNTKHEK